MLHLENSTAAAVLTSKRHNNVNKTDLTDFSKRRRINRKCIIARQKSLELQPTNQPKVRKPRIERRHEEDSPIFRQVLRQQHIIWFCLAAGTAYLHRSLLDGLHLAIWYRSTCVAACHKVLSLWSLARDAGAYVHLFDELLLASRPGKEKARARPARGGGNAERSKARKGRCEGEKGKDERVRGGSL